jgi:hypothetical protein
LLLKVNAERRSAQALHVLTKRVDLATECKQLFPLPEGRNGALGQRLACVVYGWSYVLRLSLDAGQSRLRPGTLLDLSDGLLLLRGRQLGNLGRCGDGYLVGLDRLDELGDALFLDRAGGMHAPF